jgi:hypothetical protein
MSCKKDSSIEGTWVISKTGILLTSMVDEKAQLSNSCINKKVQFEKSKIIFDTTCIFFSDIMLLTKIEKNKGALSNSGINNIDRLTAEIFGVDTKVNLDDILTYSVEKKDRNSVLSKLYLLVLNDKEIVLIDDPYFIVMKRRDSGKATGNVSK